MGIAQLRSALSRSITAENFTGEPGRGGMAEEGTGSGYARELGRGWKVSPSIPLPTGATAVLADITGPGTIQHIWITLPPQHWRTVVLRFYWDGLDSPSIAVPLADFFCQGWSEYAPVSSSQIVVAAYGGLNSYWEMPFSTAARITIENLGAPISEVYYQIDYELGPVEPNSGYLHAVWRRSNPTEPLVDHAIMESAHGPGHFVGMYMAWQANNASWWGEGEVKIFLDGDDEWPTICGTGTEDYFGGAWCFEIPGEGYGTYSTPYLGFPQAKVTPTRYHTPPRFGLYRWHIVDPVRFQESIRITVQALGIRSAQRYLPLRDDIASTALWYQATPQPVEFDYTVAELEVN